MENHGSYAAFISYRHKPLDSFVAARLHALLERYRVPSALSRSMGKKRLGRMFRDREELPITSDLTASIKSALDNSEYLIVICTPDTRESVWVNREINHFLTAHPQSSVLTVLSAGEPHDSIPDCLLHANETYSDGSDIEPLAADVRSAGKAGTLRKLRREITRIAAAMLKLPYDALRQREKAYRMRILLEVAAAAIAILLAFTGVVLAKNAEISAMNTEITEKNSDIAEKSAQIEKSYRETQISQSRYLSTYAFEALSNGDRLAAIQLALEALPWKDADRPYVADAEYALSRSLYAYQSTTWSRVKDLVLETESEVSGFVLGKGGKNAAVYDEIDILYYFDTETGELIWSVPIADLFSSDGYIWDIQDVEIDDISGNVTVSTEISVYCLSSADGSVVWQFSEGVRSIGSFTLSGETALCCIAYEKSGDNSSLYFTAIDGTTGREIASSSVPCDDTFFFQQHGALSSDERFFTVSWEYDLDSKSCRIAEFDIQSGTVSMWDGEQIFDIEHLIYSPEGDLLAVHAPTGGMASTYSIQGEKSVCVSRISVSGDVTRWRADLMANVSDGIGDTGLFCFSNAGYRPILAFNTGKSLLILDSDSGAVLKSMALDSCCVSSIQGSGDVMSVFYILRSGALAIWYTELPGDYGSILTESDYSVNTDSTVRLARMRGAVIAVSGANSRNISVWRYKNDPNNETVFECEDYISGIYCASPDEPILVICSGLYPFDGLISVYLLDQETLAVQREYSLTGFSLPKFDYTGMLPGSSGFSFLYSGIPYVFDFETGLPAELSPGKYGEFSLFAAGSSQSTILAQEPSSFEAVNGYAFLHLIDPASGEDTSIRFACEGSYITSTRDSFLWSGSKRLACHFSCNNDPFILFYNVTGKNAVTVPADDIAGSSVAAIGNQSGVYAVLTAKRTVRIYDTDTGKTQCETGKLGEATHWLAFTDDDSHLLCAGGTDTLKLIDAATGDITASLTLSASHNEYSDFQLHESTDKDSLVICVSGDGYVIDRDSFAIKAMIPDLSLYMPEHGYILCKNSRSVVRFPIYTLQQLMDWGSAEAAMQPLTEDERKSYFLE